MLYMLLKNNINYVVSHLQNHSLLKMLFSKHIFCHEEQMQNLKTTLKSCIYIQMNSKTNVKLLTQKQEDQTSHSGETVQATMESPQLSDLRLAFQNTLSLSCAVLCFRRFFAFCLFAVCFAFQSFKNHRLGKFHTLYLEFQEFLWIFS